MTKSFIAAATSLALLALAAGGYAALRLMVDRKSVTVADLTRQVEAKTAESAHLESVRERLSALAEDEAAVEAYFVPEAGVVAFIDELQARGTAVGATVEIASVAAPPASGAGRPVILIALSITGSFDAVMRALGSIEYAPYDLSVTSVTLGKSLDGTTWNANANITVGSAASSAAAPAPSTALPPVRIPVAASSTSLEATSTATSSAAHLPKKPAGSP